MWHAGRPALGLPGHSMYGCLEAGHVEGIASIYVCEDKKHGDKFVSGVRGRLAKLGFKGRLAVLKMPADVDNDIGDLWTLDPAAFLDRLGDIESEAPELTVETPARPAAGKAGPDPPRWHEPTPLTPPQLLPAFPIDALPPALADWVRAEAEATQTPPDLAALLALGICGAALAGKFTVQVRDGWREPLNLFTVVSLPAGERKSAVFTHALAPVVDFEAAEAERMRPIIAEAATEHRQLEARLKHLEGQAAKKGGGTRRPSRTRPRRSPASWRSTRCPRPRNCTATT